MNNTTLNDYIENYKRAAQKAERSATAREKARKQFLEFVDKKEGTYQDLTVALIHPEPSFDWKSLLEEYSFDQRKISKFYKENSSYLRLTVKRSISLKEDHE